MGNVAQRSCVTVQEETKEKNVKIIPRFSAPASAADLEPCDVLSGFLHCAKEDGYIDDADYEKLVQAVNSQTPRKNSKDDSAALLKKLPETPTKGVLLTGLGFAKEGDVNRQTFRLSRRASMDKESLEQMLSSSFAQQSLQPKINCEEILHDRDFNCRARGNVGEDTAAVAHGFRQPIDYLGQYSMPGEKLDTWLVEIANQYCDVPYHNWRHGFDVFQLSFLAITDGGMYEYLNVQDCCSMMIAAIAHDVGHKGMNNVFQSKAQTSLALTYNDKSPLENMHASVLFSTLLRPGANFMESLPRPEYDSIRTKIVTTILATDPAIHFPFTGRFAGRNKTGPILKYAEISEDDSDQNKADRSMLLEGFVHMWDVGNGLRPWNVYKNLVCVLEEEFWMQGDEETKLGLPVTFMMNREKDYLAAGQNFFLGQLVLPLFDLYGQLMKEDLVVGLRNNLEGNKQKWADLVAKHGQKSAKEILRLEDEFEEDDDDDGLSTPYTSMAESEKVKGA